MGGAGAACAACHALTPDGGANMAGPHLHGLFGRRMGSLPGYRYSERLARGDVVWTRETVADLFARGPDVVVPGTTMPVQRVEEAGDLEALLRDGRVALPADAVRVVADPPEKREARSGAPDLLDAISDAVDAARREVLLISPFFVPGRRASRSFATLIRRGMRGGAVLTNSLAATDVLAVHGGYARHRRRLLREGMRPGYAAEDGAALHFVGERLHKVVASRPDARAYRMRKLAAGRVARKALRSTYLGAGEPVAATQPSLRVAPEPPAATAARWTCCSASGGPSPASARGRPLRRCRSRTRR